MNGTKLFKLIVIAGLYIAAVHTCYELGELFGDVLNNNK